MEEQAIDSMMDLNQSLSFLYCIDTNRIDMLMNLELEPGEICKK